MPIRRITEGGRKLLSSGQVIIDVCSIVKELIENALDARATSIVITLEGHGLDQITVRDNGTGITQQDAQSLPLSAHTSKITSFTDLDCVRTYGFRGEALACLAEISHSFTVISRTEHDETATVYSLLSQGRLMPTKKSADPRGTTVIITKPWFRIPVRREKARREVSRLAPKLRELIDTYYLVNIFVRFQLALKAPRSGGETLTVVRVPQDTLEKALIAVHGVSAIQASTIFTHQRNGFRIDACLPKASADVRLSSGPVHRFYVDSRPVTAVRGTMKRVLQLIRRYVVDSLPHGAEVLVHLSLHCPASTYDPNIEPSKNQVYFKDEQDLMDIITSCLTKLYGNPDDALVENVSVCQEDQRVLETIAAPQPVTPDMKRTRCLESYSTSVPASSSSAHLSPRFDHPFSCESNKINLNTPPEPNRGWKFSMFEEEEDETPDEMITSCQTDPALSNATTEYVNHRAPVAESPETDYAADRPLLQNPWTIARLRTKSFKVSTISLNAAPLSATAAIKHKCNESIEQQSRVSLKGAKKHQPPIASMKKLTHIDHDRPSKVILPSSQAHTDTDGSPACQPHTHGKSSDNTMDCSTKSDVPPGQKRITAFLSRGRFAFARDDEQGSPIKKAKLYHVPEQMTNSLKAVPEGRSQLRSAPPLPTLQPKLQGGGSFLARRRPSSRESTEPADQVHDHEVQMCCALPTIEDHRRQMSGYATFRTLCDPDLQQPIEGAQTLVSRLAAGLSLWKVVHHSSSKFALIISKLDCRAGIDTLPLDSQHSVRIW